MCGSRVIESARSMPASASGRARSARRSRRRRRRRETRGPRGARSREGVEVVDGAGVGGAGVADDEEGPVPRGAVARDRLGERVGTDPEARRRTATAGRGAPGSRRAAPPSRPSGAPGRRRRACRRGSSRADARRRAVTSAEKFESEPPVVSTPPGGRREADHLAEPADDVRLELRRARARRRRRRRSGS